MSLRISTTVLLQEQISELKIEIPKRRQELAHLQRELAVLESAVRRLPDQQMLFRQEPAKQVSDGPMPVQVLKVSVVRAARAILRDCGKPMRVKDILSALHEAGRTDIKLRRLNASLHKDLQKGNLSRPAIGTYAYIDRATRLLELPLQLNR